MHCHHDELVLSERDISLMRHFLKWVDTARQTYGPGWAPSDIDMLKSRLFWWVRSGHDPLPYPPPTAYSCPWYEVVTDPGAHGALECRVCESGDEFGVLRSAPGVFVSQCWYELIEKRDDGSFIIGFGPYRFRAFRDRARMIDRAVSINGGRDEVAQWAAARFDESEREGWFLTRMHDLEPDTLTTSGLSEENPLGDLE